MSNMFFHFQYAPSLFAFRQQNGAVPRKLKKLITSNYKMSMSTNSANNCVYNKTAYINKH